MIESIEESTNPLTGQVTSVVKVLEASTSYQAYLNSRMDAHVQTYLIGGHFEKVKRELLVQTNTCQCFRL